MTYSLNGDFASDTEYTFSYTFKSSFDNDYNDYGWDELEVKYIEYSVTFDLGEGKAGSNDYSDQSVVSGKKANDPGDPTPPDGMVFSGWKNGDEDFSFDDAITAKTTLVAQYTQNDFDVTYNVKKDDAADGPSTVTGYPKTESKNKGTDVTLPSIADQSGTKDGKTGTWKFLGWASDDEDVTINDGYFTMPEKDVTLYGTWAFVEADSSVTHTVTFDSNGGSDVDAQTVTEGESATKPSDPTKKGYTFLGWKLNTAGEDDGYYDFDNTTVTEDITLVAQWDDYTVERDSTVNADTKGHTYEIYQIFTGDYYDNSDTDNLLNVVWGTNGTGTVGEAVSEEALEKLATVVDEELDSDKLAVIKDYVNLKSTPVATIAVDGDKASVDLPAGYYLIKDKDDSLTGDEAYTTYITKIVKDYTIEPKVAQPTVKKEVEDNDDGVSDGDNNGYGNTADHAIGEPFNFKLTATLPEDDDFAAYEKYKVVFTDTMSAGITFDEIVSVEIDGKTVPAGKYSASEVKDQSWTLTIDDVKTAVEGGVDISEGCSIVVIYKAHLNENAASSTAKNTSVTTSDANTNKVTLSYSNNPNAGGESSTGTTTTDDYVWVFTYEVDNKKVDGSNNNAALEGAGFTLYDSTGAAIKFTYDETNKVYYRDDTNGTAEVTSTSDGTFNLKGLDAGTYTLKETSTPTGYNTCPDTEIVIEAVHEENEGGNTSSLTLGENTKNMNNELINKKGSVMPSTGGIGTTIFYVAGAILVIGAGVVLITRRRMMGE